jgi:choline dehydrogenase-like flavoprotein
MTMAPSQLGAFVRSDPSRDTPNLQYHVQPLTLPKFGERLDPFPAFTASVANLRPTSRGWVRVTSPEPQAHPEIRPNYLSTQDDRRVAADAVRITRHIVSRPALARYHPQEFRPGPEIEGDGRWRVPPATSARPFSIPSGPARWAATRRRWWTPGSGCAAWLACAWPTLP